MTNIKKIFFILAVLVMSVGVGYLAFAATTWVDAPAGTPPACPAGTPGCDRPIHVGATAQTRAGALTINADLTANLLRDTANNAFFVDPANAGIAGLFAGNVGIGTTTTPTERLEVAGGVRLNTTVARPACDATRRGTIWFVQSATGVEDRFDICTRTAAGALVWSRAPLAVIPTSVTVTPNPHSQMINTTHTFSAVVHPTGTSQSVTWSLVNSVGLTGASISTAGVFSSGTTVGTVTVRATSTVDTTIHGDSSVTVIGPTRRIFVTSTMHAPNLGGLTGADSICQWRANTAGLGGTWRAWLSSSTVHARDRLVHHGIPIYLTGGGGRVANNWAGLTSGNLLRSISRDEWGGTVTPGAVFTGTNTDGTRLSVCGAWDGTDTTSMMTMGCEGHSGSGWTVCGTQACTICCHRLYCLEQ